MTDHPIPDDLADRLAEAKPVGVTCIASDGHPSVRLRSNREAVAVVLAALTSWADEVGATHIALDGWRRVKAETRGVDYCTRHHGIRNEDAHGCDFQEECPKCGGFPDGIRECRRCGDSGADPCVLTPLYTLKDS